MKETGAHHFELIRTKWPDKNEAVSAKPRDGAVRGMSRAAINSAAGVFVALFTKKRRRQALEPDPPGRFHGTCVTGALFFLLYDLGFTNLGHVIGSSGTTEQTTTARCLGGLDVVLAHAGVRLLVLCPI